MLASASKNMTTGAASWCTCPASSSPLTVLAFTLVGDGLRHAFGTRREPVAEGGV